MDLDVPEAAPARRIVVHADDVGMCHGANAAFAELSALRTVTAGSVMVPCPWFEEVAVMAEAAPALDVGVHLTLNSEMRSYRWGPVSRPSAAAGLTDHLGYLWPTVAELQANAHPEAVEAEWRAQIERALAAGLDVTHLDAHMGSALAPQWCDRYVAVALEYRLPALLTGSLSGYDASNHLRGATEEQYVAAIEPAVAAGLPIFTRMLETDFGRPRGVPADYRAKLAGAPDGLVYCAFHPCRPGPGEIEVIEPGQHHVRVDEYELFRTPEWAQWLHGQPFELVGMRDLRDEWRAAHPA